MELIIRDCRDIQGWAKRQARGLMNFVPAVAYLFCLALPAMFTQPGIRLFANPCISPSFVLKAPNQDTLLSVNEMLMPSAPFHIQMTNRLFVSRSHHEAKGKCTFEGNSYLSFKHNLRRLTTNCASSPRTPAI